MPLDLLVPDLLAAPEGLLSSVRLAALERLLARADLARRGETTPVKLLASAFRLPSPAPVAAITLAADDRAQPGTWLRADPVHLRVQQDAITLHDAGAFGIDRGESEALVAALQAFFQADGMRFHAPVPQRWYVQLAQAEAPCTVELDEVLGRNLFGRLPSGGASINWPSALTESQMLMSSHAVNVQREAEGRPAINSVWFWGEGALPARVDSPYASVYADEVFARGLAAVSGTRVAPPPAGPAGVDTVREGESVLVVLDALTEPLRRGDEAAWKAAAERLEREWLADLWSAIDRFESVRLVLPARRDTLVANVTSALKWRWFRKPRPLAAHA